MDTAEWFSAVSTQNKIILINRRGLSCGGAAIYITEPQRALFNNSFTTSALSSRLLNAHQQALANMQSLLGAQAKQYVLAINAQSSPPDTLFLVQQAAHQYEATIQDALRDASSTINGLANLIESNLKRDGWIMMGAWYQTFAQANVQASSMANATAAVYPVQISIICRIPSSTAKYLPSTLSSINRLLPPPPHRDLLISFQQEPPILSMLYRRYFLVRKS